MIVELVLFKNPPGLDRAAELEGARAVVNKWRANPDLVRKHFMRSEDGKLGGAVYVWKSRAAADAAHGPEWEAAVKARTGSEPTRQFFELFLVVEDPGGTAEVSDGSRDAEASGSVVGAAMVGYDGHRGWVNYLAVDESRRGEGIGAALMAEAERLLVERGCPKLNLQVRSTMTGVLRPIASATTDIARLSAIPWASLFSELKPHGANNTTPRGGRGRIARSK